MAAQLKAGKVPSDPAASNGHGTGKKWQGALPQTKQQQVHQMGASVMQFEMAKTLHVFKMTETGGVQQVVVRNEGDKGPGAAHTAAPSARGQQISAGGDYSDPAALHGLDMPGLKELQVGARLMKITYSALTNGGEINFWTNDFRMMVCVASLVRARSSLSIVRMQLPNDGRQ